jgi:periplasmic protein TonB
MHPSLTKAFLTSMLVHLTALMSLSLVWGALHTSMPRSELIPTEMVVLPPPLAMLEPATTSEVEPLTPPEILTKTDVTLAKTPATPLPEPRVPEKLEPLTPPKALDKPLPKRPDARPKPPPAVKRLPAEERPPDPPPGSDTKALAKPKPGPLMGMPDEGSTLEGDNTLGPSSTATPVDQPASSIEGGEAGAGELSERGDLPVVPGGGVGGGSSGPGRAGLGWGAEGSGVQVGGLRPGAGVSGFARPLGGYQQLPRYPDSARRQGITGTTVLLFEVKESGTVGEVQIERSAGHPDLDQAAAEAVKKWRFEPARRGKQAVAAWLRMPVKFVLK